MLEAVSVTFRHFLDPSMLGSTSRKPLIRSNSHSDRTTMRNLPLFMFLIGLVLFFYVFYVYQAQNASLSMATEEIEKLNSQLVQSKNKLVDTMAELETSKSDKTRAKLETDAAKKNQEECSISLRTAKLRLDLLEKEKNEYQGQSTKFNAELIEIKATLNELQQNSTTMVRIIATQEALIAQLKQTISLMKTEPPKVTSETQPSNVRVQADAQAHLMAQPDEQKQQQPPLVELAQLPSTQQENAGLVSTSTTSKPEELKENGGENDQVDEPKVAELQKHGEDKEKDFNADQEEARKPRVNGGEYEE